MAMPGLASKCPPPTRAPGNFRRPWRDATGRGPRARSSATFTSWRMPLRPASRAWLLVGTARPGNTWHCQGPH